MTSSSLPEIVLTCRNGHEFATKARGGTTVRCKTCGAPKHVPADRPRTARAAASTRAALVHEDQDQDEARELADRWKREPEWDGRAMTRDGRPGDACPECSGQLNWEPGRTLTYCPACKRVDLPAAVANHYDRQAQRRAEVATRSTPDKSAQRAARTRLRALKERARERVSNYLETLADEECYDRSQWQRQARELAAMLRGYLPEIADAEDEAELAEVWQDINALITGDEGRALRAEYDEAQNRAERRYEAQQQTAQREREREQHQRELAAQQERERREQERQRVTAATGRRAMETAQRKALPPAPRDSTAVAAAQLGAMLEQRLRERNRKIAENGECEFWHLDKAPADRIYGVPFRDAMGRMTGNAISGTPQYRACKLHYGKAEKKLNRENYADVCYWDLPIQQTGQIVDYGYGYGWNG